MQSTETLDNLEAIAGGLRELEGRGYDYAAVTDLLSPALQVSVTCGDLDELDGYEPEAARFFSTHLNPDLISSWRKSTTRSNFG